MSFIVRMTNWFLGGMILTSVLIGDAQSREYPSVIARGEVCANLRPFYQDWVRFESWSQPVNATPILNRRDRDYVLMSEMLCNPRRPRSAR